MARSRSLSCWRYLNPAYYLKRPKKLALLFMAFVMGTLFVWDRQSLLREHEEETAKLYSEVNRLQEELEGVKSSIGVKNDFPATKIISDDPIDVERRQKVKEAMLHAWSSYEKYAWGQDELQPQSKSGVNSFGGLGATLIDSLDTLYIMGLDEQFQRARDILADSGTEQVEFIALSQRTGDPKYQQKVENVISVFNKTFPEDGLLPIYISPDSGTGSRTTITFGAMGDSFYEYLLKVWIQGNKTASVKLYREMWEKSMNGLLTLIQKTTPSSFTYICERNGNSLHHKMDELACFAPGMLALGSSGYGPEDSKKFMSLAQELAWTCYNFYQSTPTKLAGENYFFHEGRDMSVGTSWNILRPETVESLFYLWRLTGNKTYQEWGWNIFQAFEKNSRVEGGYVGLKDVNSGVKDNMMQSFFLAETLKYMYLLFSPPSLIPLDQWVFNTEAHPLKIVTRSVSGEQRNRPFIRQRARKEGRN
ncbi:hypothetical protein BVRB_7g177650 [Beta vulgaris subsp. vulgaris]|uniref:alpha-1,2-Mannosidase n=1 Tax=Beta vulgaris subsp. vulgaris TaxID=3555 RepID=A0A0J8BB33_BETVV|nr:hypothetical protein BVRB_7g177650 [Beta vulgaris subsp. vulgaris]